MSAVRHERSPRAWLVGKPVLEPTRLARLGRVPRGTKFRGDLVAPASSHGSGPGPGVVADSEWPWQRALVSGVAAP
jgi:hypothetical protein